MYNIHRYLILIAYSDSSSSFTLKLFCLCFTWTCPVAISSLCLTTSFQKKKKMLTSLFCFGNLKSWNNVQFLVPIDSNVKTVYLVKYYVLVKYICFWFVLALQIDNQFVFIINQLCGHIIMWPTLFGSLLTRHCPSVVQFATFTWICWDQSMTEEGWKSSNKSGMDILVSKRTSLFGYVQKTNRNIP